MQYLHFENHNCVKAIENCPFFPNQGNKIFASLQEDGIGGDIVIFEDGYKSVLKVKDYKFAYPISCGLRTHIGCKIIGIQE